MKTEKNNTETNKPKLKIRVYKNSGKFGDYFTIYVGDHKAFIGAEHFKSLISRAEEYFKNKAGGKDESKS